MEFSWLLAPPIPPGTARQHLLYQRLRTAIVEGRIASGTRLPASRALAAELGIARNTVLHAYEQLGAEGCLVANRHGTRVATLPAREPPPAAACSGSPQSESVIALPGLSQRARAMPDAGGDPASDTLPFAVGVPDIGTFPLRAWRACLDRAWRGASARQLGYAPHGGEPALREALADYLTTTRGFTLQPDQVVITSGTQGALDLCARLLADHGDTVWIENPGYPAARTALALAGLRLHAVPVDEEGLAPGAADWHTHAPRLILATPAHQYPTGRVMSLPRRLTLLDGACRSGAWLIEDDYDSEFRRAGAALPALLGLVPGAPVLYTGTFSKTLYPGLRLAYLIVPQPLAPAFVRAAGQATRPGQAIEQRALADFIRRGHYTAHLHRMRQCYAARQRELRDALTRHPGPELAVTGGDAGLHLTLWLPPELADYALCEAARRLGLGPQPLSRYALAPLTCNGLLLGYGNTGTEYLDAAVRRLRTAMGAIPERS